MSLACECVNGLRVSANRSGVPGGLSAIGDGAQLQFEAVDDVRAHGGCSVIGVAGFDRGPWRCRS